MPEVVNYFNYLISPKIGRVYGVHFGTWDTKGYELEIYRSSVFNKIMAFVNIEKDFITITAICYSLLAELIITALEGVKHTCNNKLVPYFDRLYPTKVKFMEVRLKT